MLLFIGIMIACVALYVFCLPFKVLVDKPIKTISYIPKDVYYYFTRYKNIPKKPFINVYCGLFGSGKTLSAVHDVIAFYKEYNGKRVYDDRVGEFVTQYVEILSNVELIGVPYVSFESLQQLVDIGVSRHEIDKKNKVRTITIVLGDEFSVQMNSRNFSGANKNIDGFFLNALLTSRHSLVHAFYLTSQRFEHMDALLRQVSTNVIECKKIWRIQENIYYDAYQREHSSRPEDLKPTMKTAFLVQDKDYKAYDTLQVVKNLAKSCHEGDMISEEEIIKRIGNNDRHGAKEKKKRGARKL